MSVYACEMRGLDTEVTGPFIAAMSIPLHGGRALYIPVHGNALVAVSYH
jgi:uncharacterized protein YfaP (DUF2135 family)